MTVTLQDLKPAQIKPHKNNPRRVVGDLDELAASIGEQGILEPLIVAPNGTGDTYVLIAGHRRLAAAKQAKAKTVPCLVRDDLTDPAVQLEAMLVENLQRADLTAVEEAQAYQQLLEFPGYTQPRIAKTTGRAIGTVRARLKLAQLPKPALSCSHAAARRRRTSTSTAAASVTARPAPCSTRSSRSASARSASAAQSAASMQALPPAVDPSRAQRRNARRAGATTPTPSSDAAASNRDGIPSRPTRRST